jgi:hypothetical protein
MAASPDTRLYMVAETRTDIALGKLEWKEKSFHAILFNFTGQPVEIIHAKAGFYLVKMELKYHPTGYLYVRFAADRLDEMFSFLVRFDQLSNNHPSRRRYPVSYKIDQSIDDATFERFLKCGVSISTEALYWLKEERKLKSIRIDPSAVVFATPKPRKYHALPSTDFNPFSLLSETTA